MSQIGEVEDNEDHEHHRIHFEGPNSEVELFNTDLTVEDEEAEEEEEIKHTKRVSARSSRVSKRSSRDSRRSSRDSKRSSSRVSKRSSSRVSKRTSIIPQRLSQKSTHEEGEDTDNVLEEETFIRDIALDTSSGETDIDMITTTKTSYITQSREFSTFGQDIAEYLTNIEGYFEDTKETDVDSICKCVYYSMSSSTDTETGPTASEVLHATLVNHEIYDEHEKLSMYDDSMGSSADGLTWGNVGERIEPFILERNFGQNLSVRPICLMSKNRHEIFYTTSHKGVIYDYEYQRMRFIHGHSNTIVSASIENSGKYLVTSDFGENSTIMITDTILCATVTTIYNDIPDYGATLVEISPNGKYLISIHPEEHPAIKLWFWTYGNEKPDDIYMYSGRRLYGDPKRISFHPNIQEYVMIAFEKQVLFFRLDVEKKLFCPPVIPKLKKKIGLITDCAMVLDCHECFTCTAEGYVQVFGNAIYTEGFDEHSVNENKFYVKSIRVSIHPIVYLHSIDGFLVVIDSAGCIQFFDTGVRLLFWIPHRNYDSIVKSMSFAITPRIYIFDDPFNMNNDFFYMPNPLDYLEMQPEDRVPEFEVLYKNTVPSTSSLEHHSFITRCHISVCSDGKIFLTDLVRNDSKQIVDVSGSTVAAIDCSDESPYLIIAYVDGRISLYNFKTSELIKSSTVLEGKSLSCVKISPQGLFFAATTSNGQIWFLNMVLEPDPPKELQVTNRQIIKICFSHDSLFCAFYDISDVLYIIRFVDSSWKYIGKMRTHNKPIRGIMFVGSNPIKLFTIGEDRYLIEYAIDNSIEDITIKSRVRIEQSALPYCFEYYPAPEGVSYIIIANSQQKYKLIQESNRMCRSVDLAPSHGCYGDLALEKIMFLPQSNNKYMLFMNTIHIGIQKLPLDGNPYKYIGLIGNPNMKDFCVSSDGSCIFTCGQNDSSVLMWRINKHAIDILHRLGGTDLDPYYCLIDGGIHGWFFKEMRDLFVYMQILHQGDFYQPQTFGQILDISELPDLLRSCGFYPTESEVEDILNDIKYRDFESTGELRNEISFTEFVKLYVNHKPSQGILNEELEMHFKNLSPNSRSSISKDQFIEAMCQHGEAFTVSNFEKCLTTTLKQPAQPAGSKEPFHFLPHGDSLFSTWF